MNHVDLLADLDKWQAYNHPELGDRRPHELFDAVFIERYDRLHRHIWGRMIRLHGTLHSLETLMKFPLADLYAQDSMEFWRLVQQNFLDAAVLILHGLVNDTGPDANTLRSLKNELVCAPWLDPDLCDIFKKTCKERKFDPVMDSIAKRLDDIRDNCIAHQLVDKQTGHPKVPAVLSYEEVRRLFDASHSLFGAISFGASYITLVGDLTPSTVGGKPTRSCLDTVLDAIIRDSNFVNTPERRPERWLHERKYWKAEDLQVMNELRKRIGLPDA